MMSLAGVLVFQYQNIFTDKDIKLLCEPFWITACAEMPKCRR